MSGARIAAIVLIVAGVLGLAYGGFTYTKTTHDAKIGPLEFSVKDKERVNVPVWAGVAAMVAGGVLLCRALASPLGMAWAHFLPLGAPVVWLALWRAGGGRTLGCKRARERNLLLPAFRRRLY